MRRSSVLHAADGMASVEHCFCPDCAAAEPPPLHRGTPSPHCRRQVPLVFRASCAALPQQPPARLAADDQPAPPLGSRAVQGPGHAPLAGDHEAHPQRRECRDPRGTRPRSAAFNPFDQGLERCRGFRAVVSHHPRKRETRRPARLVAQLGEELHVMFLELKHDG